MFAHAIPQISSGRKGIHVAWAGPRAWLYSPTGWLIQRRIFDKGRLDLDCVKLASVDVERLRARHERTIRHGVLTLRQGEWVKALAAIAAASQGQPCEVITLEFNRPQSFVRFDVEASASFVVGLRDGKSVAGGTVVTALAADELSAPEIDTVVMYALGLKTFGVCILRGAIRPAGTMRRL